MRRFIRIPKIPDILDVLCDDREKRPLSLPSDHFRMTRKRLRTGDYTFRGLESIVAIERKNGLAEIVTDLSYKVRPRFVAMLHRLSRFPVRLMIVEGDGPRDTFNIIDYRTGESVSTVRTVMYWLSAISVKYRVPVIFTGPLTPHGFIGQIFEDAYQAGIAWQNGGKDEKEV